LELDHYLFMATGGVGLHEIRVGLGAFEVFCRELGVKNYDCTAIVLEGESGPIRVVCK
jgi:hypothetical protein